MLHLCALIIKIKHFLNICTEITQAWQVVCNHLYSLYWYWNRRCSKNHHYTTYERYRCFSNDLKFYKPAWKVLQLVCFTFHALTFSSIETVSTLIEKAFCVLEYARAQTKKTVRCAKCVSRRIPQKTRAAVHVSKWFIVQRNRLFV